MTSSSSPVESMRERRPVARGLLGRAFVFPEGAWYQDLMGGVWQSGVVETLEALPFSVGLSDLNLARPRLTKEHFQAEYVRLFEVGFMGGPPCSLFAGHHERDRQRLMEELIRFYEFFGLHLAQGRMPDHLSAELEFMHFLAFREAEALGGDGDRGSFLRAQRDFLERHLVRFLAALAERVRAQDPPPFYQALAEVGHRFTREDHGHVTAALASL